MGNSYSIKNVELQKVEINKVLNDLFISFVEEGEGVVLNPKTDQQIIDKFLSKGAQLFLSEGRDDICLTELTTLVNKQANTEHPIRFVYSNPSRANFSSDKNFYNYKLDLILKAKELEVCAIDELNENVFQDSFYEFLFNKQLERYNHVISIKSFSRLAPEMTDSQVANGLSEIILQYNRNLSKLVLE